MHEDGLNIRGMLQDARYSLEKAWGLSFSIMMSGVFSRMIRDPTGEGYRALVDTLNTELLTPAIIVITILALAVAYYSEMIPAWMSGPHRYYITLGVFMLFCYISGYLMYDVTIMALTLFLVSECIITLMTLNKERWGVRTPWFVSRFIDRD